MSKLRRALMQAAGGGIEATYVEDLFATNVWTGDDSEPRGIPNNINLGDFGVGTSTKFDGESDYLSRSSDLTGNSDSKTFTFSCWVFMPARDLGHPSNQRMLYATDSSDNGFMINVDASMHVGIEAWDGGSRTLQATTTTKVGVNTWTHILISIDMANSSNRYIYFNDVAASVTWNSYVNQNIEFTRPTHYIGAWGNGTRQFYDSMAHLYLDYTFRDLTTTSVRRNFIDANGGSTPPSTLTALNPIVYLPMTSNVVKNEGTGGNFTAVGSPTIVENGTQYVANSGDGGLVWTKCRSTGGSSESHLWYTTDIGGSAGYLRSNSEEALRATSGEMPLKFNSNGFTMPVKSFYDRLNDNGYTFASWTFKKHPGFFDVVTWDGDGQSSRYIPHNLGSVPGMIIVKSYQHVSGVGNTDWQVYHRGLNGGNSPHTYGILLNSNNQESATSNFWFNTAPTSTQFRIGGGQDLNGTGGKYVAYLFAHDVQEFGTDSDQSVIKCGYYTGNGATSNLGQKIDLGFEPQWIMIKRVNGSGQWMMGDHKRSLSSGVNDGQANVAWLYANQYDQEQGVSTSFGITETGFYVNDNTSNANTDKYIYVAIRRPHKPATEFNARDLFEIDTGYPNDHPGWRAGFEVDMALDRSPEFGDNNRIADRRTAASYLETNSTSPITQNSNWNFNYDTGWSQAAKATNDYSWMWRRAPGFFDVVVPSNGSPKHASTEHFHNLGVPPELIIAKARDASQDWYVGVSRDITISGNDMQLTLNSNGTGPSTANFNFGVNTDTTFLSTLYGTNAGYIHYLFASVPGIAKIGMYTGNGLQRVIDCGFSNGVRFVMIKRTDSNSDWGVWDTERGMPSGANGKMLMLNNSTAQQDVRWVYDGFSNGFGLKAVDSYNTEFNVVNAQYLFYAIAN